MRWHMRCNANQMTWDGARGTGRGLGWMKRTNLHRPGPDVHGADGEIGSARPADVRWYMLLRHEEAMPHCHHKRILAVPTWHEELLTNKIAQAGGRRWPIQCRPHAS